MVTYMEMFDPFGPSLLLAFVAFVSFRIGQATKAESPAARSHRVMAEQEDINAAIAQVDDREWGEIDQLLAEKKKIAAIKALREATGLGLKLSRMAIEQRQKGR